MKYELGILGTGTMGTAILGRIVEEKKLSPANIALFDINRDKVLAFQKDGFHVASDAQEIADNCSVVLFSVKPQHFRSITQTVKFSEKNTILSIMAGVKIDTLRRALNYPCPIVRVMPNMPCKIGKGVCGVKFSEVDPVVQTKVNDWLSSCGGIVPIEENCFDAVTSVSGSGPAYIYMFIDGLIKGGMEGGLTYDQSKKLAIETMIGTAESYRNSTEPLSELVEKVCSKGGTTIEAVNIYREKDLEGIIVEGINACRKRSEELSKE